MHISSATLKCSSLLKPLAILFYIAFEFEILFISCCDILAFSRVDLLVISMSFIVARAVFRFWRSWRILCVPCVIMDFVILYLLLRFCLAL